MNYQNINHDSPRLDPSLQAYQADFADHVSRGDAGDAFVRGNLEGDVRFPKGPVYAHAVTEWEARTEPRLSPTHDAVGRALASFFTEDGGWVYLTQDMIADEGRLRRQSVNRPLQDLVAAGRIERREMKTHQGHRGHAYRLTGEDTGWQPTNLGIPGRVTAAGFKKELEKFALEEALLAVVELLPADSVLPDSVLTLLEVINSRREDKSDFLRRLEETSGNGNNVPLSSKTVDSALDSAAESTGSLITQSQLIKIITELKRTGLSEEDIRASWPEIHLYSEFPENFELLSSSRAFRMVAWLEGLPKAPVVEVEPEVPCRCEEVVAAAAASSEAQEKWASALEVLATAVPEGTFDTWLKATAGHRCEGDVLVVRVPSIFTGKWLEDRMYQTILGTLRTVAGAQWDMRFEAAESVVCAAHGTSALDG